MITDEKIGEISLYSFNGDSERIPLTLNYGHSFIMIKNTSNVPYYVDTYILHPNETCTFSTWLHSRHAGIWFNLELVYVSLDRYKGKLSLTADLHPSDLTTLNLLIKKNNRWSIKKNCAYLSSLIFDTITGSKFCCNDIKPIKLCKLMSQNKDVEIDKWNVNNVYKIGFTENRKFKSFELIRKG